MDQLQSKPGTTKIPLVFNANMRDVDFGPLRLRLVVRVEQIELLERRLLIAVGVLLNSKPFGLLELSQMRNHTLTRPTLSAVRLDQCPVGMVLSILPSITRPYIYARILQRIQQRTSSKVFTTSPFKTIRPNFSNKPKPHPP